MAVTTLLLLLPVITNAQISINIQAYNEDKDSSLQAFGISQSIISAEDEKAFKLTEKTLKDSVYRLTNRTPTNVYLHGPTPWNDLYKTYGWRPVSTIIKPLNIKIVDAKRSDVVLNKRTVKNEDSIAKKDKVFVSAKVDNKVACFWKQTDSFDVDIDYDINIVIGGTNFNLNSTFGKSIEDNKIVDMRSPSVELDLKPNKEYNLVFSCTKVKLTIEVEYLVKLEGFVATNNEVKLNRHHFWAYDIKSIMKAAALQDSKNPKEIITVEYCIDNRIEVMDGAS